MTTYTRANEDTNHPGESTKAAKAEFLRNNINKQITGFKDRRNLNRRNAIWIKITVSLLSTVVTVLLGLRIVQLSDLFSNLALLFSGLITILSTIDTFFNYRILWIRYTGTVNQLQSLSFDLEYLLLKGEHAIQEKEIDDLYHRYSSILAETNESWADVRKDQSQADK